MPGAGRAAGIAVFAFAVFAALVVFGVFEVFGAFVAGAGAFCAKLACSARLSPVNATQRQVFTRDVIRMLVYSDRFLGAGAGS